MNHTDCELSLQQIMENNDSCVKEIRGNRIYLNTADRISISEKGIPVMLNEAGDCAYIPELCTDETGCFIPVNFNRDAADNYRRTCSGCGWQYFVSC